MTKYMCPECLCASNVEDWGIVKSIYTCPCCDTSCSIKRIQEVDEKLIPKDSTYID